MNDRPKRPRAENLPDGEKLTIRFSVCVGEKLNEALKTVALRNRLSVAALVRRALHREIERGARHD